MSNIYLNVPIERFLKLQFSRFEIFLTRPVFGDLQLTQISLNFKTSYFNLKIRGLGAKQCVAFHYSNFESNYDILNSRHPCTLLNSNINFNQNEAESEMGNPTHSFRETNFVLQPM